MLLNISTLIITESPHKVWNKTHWQKSSLDELGLILNLGHEGNPCGYKGRTERMLVIHSNGLHHIRLVFCACATELTDALERNQLLRTLQQLQGKLILRMDQRTSLLLLPLEQAEREALHTVMRCAAVPEAARPEHTHVLARLAMMQVSGERDEHPRL